MIERARGCVGGRGRKGEGENLLAFYVSNYTKDGTTYPTGRSSPPLPHPVPFAASQPANTRPPLFSNPPRLLNPSSTPLRSSLLFPTLSSLLPIPPLTGWQAAFLCFNLCAKCVRLSGGFYLRGVRLNTAVRTLPLFFKTAASRFHAGAPPRAEDRQSHLLPPPLSLTPCTLLCAVPRLRGANNAARSCNPRPSPIPTATRRDSQRVVEERAPPRGGVNIGTRLAYVTRAYSA